MVQMNAPQQCGEPDDTYHRHCDAAVQLHHVTFERTQSCLDPNQACHFDETNSTIPTIHEAPEASRPGIQLTNICGMRTWKDGDHCYSHSNHGHISYVFDPGGFDPGGDPGPNNNQQPQVINFLLIISNGGIMGGFFLLIIPIIWTN